MLPSTDLGAQRGGAERWARRAVRWERRGRLHGESIRALARVGRDAAPGRARRCAPGREGRRHDPCCGENGGRRLAASWAAKRRSQRNARNALTGRAGEAVDVRCQKRQARASEERMASAPGPSGPRRPLWGRNQPMHTSARQQKTRSYHMSAGEARLTSGVHVVTVAAQMAR
jgi:hypothetical protein